MRVLITGGAGFLGSNLASAPLDKGDELCIFDSLCRYGADANISRLRSKGTFHFIHGDVRSPNDTVDTVRSFRPDVVYHLAGQVAMTTSISNPRRDFETNALGTFNVLESVRDFCPDATVIYSSTNKVYGDLEWVRYEKMQSRWAAPDFPDGFNETAKLDFHSPYGVSKGVGDQYCLDFHRIYGLKTIVFRHSSMYGGRQFSTADQGWIGWFTQKAIEQSRARIPAPAVISGDGLQVRDVLYVDDMLALYDLAVLHREKAAGHVFNIGGGMQNSLSLVELFSLLQEITGNEFLFTRQSARISDQKVFVADIKKSRDLLHWEPKMSARNGLLLMCEWVKSIGGY